MLTGIHILLTLKCTNECEHCFLHCGPSREATFTIGQLRTLVRQIEELGTVNIVYFEGGEPFLFYPLLLEGLRMVRAAGLDGGIVTNGYWATSVEDALYWLTPIRDLGLADFSVSDDEFHRLDKNDRRAEFTRQAAQQLGIPTGTICIEPPSVSPQAAEDRRGKPVVGGGVLFKGRAAEKLTAGLLVRPCEELTTCPHEDLLSPERVHVDAYGNVHLCQGLTDAAGTTLAWEKETCERADEKSPNASTPQTTVPKPEVGERAMSDDADIRQVSEDWIRFYNAGDAARVVGLYTEDAYYLSAHILAHGRQEIQAYWERGIKAGGHIDFIKPVTIYYSGNLAYCAGTYQATNAGVTVDGRILIVLIKVDGKWLMAAHETVVRDQPL